MAGPLSECTRGPQSAPKAVLYFVKANIIRSCAEYRWIGRAERSRNQVVCLRGNVCVEVSQKGESGGLVEVF